MIANKQTNNDGYI